MDGGECLEELAGVDLVLLDALVVDHFTVLLGDVDVGEGLTVDTFNVVWTEEVHVFVVAGKLEGDVGDNDTE